MVTITQLCKFIKIHRTVYVKRINFTVSELYLNKKILQIGTNLKLKKNDNVDQCLWTLGNVLASS